MCLVRQCPSRGQKDVRYIQLYEIFSDGDGVKNLMEFIFWKKAFSFSLRKVLSGARFVPN